MRLYSLTTLACMFNADVRICQTLFKSYVTAAHVRVPVTATEESQSGVCAIPALIALMAKIIVVKRKLFHPYP